MRAELVHFTLFDVGSELEIPRIRRVLGVEPHLAPLVARAPTPRYAAFPAPLEVLVSPAAIGPLPEGAGVEVRIHAIGAVTVRVRVPVEVADHAELIRVAESLHLADQTLPEAARFLLDQMGPDLEAAKTEPYDVAVEPETYLVYCLHEAGPIADRLLTEDRRTLAGMIEGEADPERLAADKVGDALKHVVRYYREDAVIVGWENAIVIAEPGQYEDVLDVAELANLELLEFRTYDAYLDRTLTEAFAALDRLWARGGLFRSARETLSELAEIRVDFARLTDNLHDTGKVFGDWYIAKVHQRLRDRFHLPDWEEAVASKMETLEDMFQLAEGETNHRRAMMLELMIVLLFVIDLVLLYLAAG